MLGAKKHSATCRARRGAKRGVGGRKPKVRPIVVRSGSSSRDGSNGSAAKRRRLGLDSAAPKAAAATPVPEEPAGLELGWGGGGTTGFHQNPFTHVIILDSVSAQVLLAESIKKRASLHMHGSSGSSAPALVTPGDPAATAHAAQRAAGQGLFGNVRAWVCVPRTGPHLTSSAATPLFLFACSLQSVAGGFHAPPSQVLPARWQPQLQPR